MGRFIYRRLSRRRVFNRRVILSIQLRKLLLYIFLFMGFIILLSVIILGIGGSEDNKYNIPKFAIKPNDIVFNEKNGGGPKIKVYITKEQKIKEMFLEEYVRGVVSAEMPAAFDLEALKAQAVAARTFALSHMSQFGGSKCDVSNGADICDTVHCQVYLEKDERLNEWPENSRGEYWNKITEAVQATSGMVLTYDGKLVMEPYYFAVSSGKTEDAAEVFSASEPYLKSVSSKGEEVAPNYKTIVSLSYKELADKINTQYPTAKVTSTKLKSQISIVSKTQGSSVKTIKLGSITITGQQFRNLLGLKSANFSFNFTSKEVEITVLGYGHGVGMSQWGANVMAKSGSKYDEILAHYYQGIAMGKIDGLTK